MTRDQSHAAIYGMARHPKWYERRVGQLAAPLYRRVAEDVAAAGLPDGALVLDVGTGPGRVPLLITTARPGLAVEGVDLSTEMIAWATHAAAEAGADRTRFQVADVAHLPYVDGVVDLVVSSISMHHWSDPVAGLREISRVLRPGAQAWIYDFRPALWLWKSWTRDLPADAHVEKPLLGASWFNPIGRLVISKTGPATT